MNWLSLLLPLAYLTVLIGSLATFSSLHRRRQAAKALSLAPWFPPNLQRNVYLTLLELQSTSQQKIPDSVIKAALLRRAIEGIRRLVTLRQQKPALGQLLQRGSVGDELWQRFQIAEKAMEAELQDISMEASALGPASGNQQGPNAPWGQLIFASASEAVYREMMTKTLKSIEARRPVEKVQWERQRDGVREGFMKELEADAAAADKEKDAAARKTGSSDEEVVVVGGGGDDTADGTSSAKKKKKNKK